MTINIFTRIGIFFVALIGYILFSGIFSAVSTIGIYDDGLTFAYLGWGIGAFLYALTVALMWQ